MAKAKYYIYWNFHKKCWSVKRRGRVVLHANAIIVTDPEFRVSDAGRDKVRREGVKNVHAHVVCETENLAVVRDYDELPKCRRRAYYNPYKTVTFVDYEAGTPLYAAHTARLHTDGTVTYC